MKRASSKDSRSYILANQKMYLSTLSDYLFSPSYFPSHQTSYSIYTKDAVFHDPVGIAQGVESIRAQFNGLAKLFPRADIPRFRILENPPSVPTNVILIDQDTVNSLLTLETNDSHQVTRHTEEWNHKHESTKDDGFIGMLNEERKKMTANLTAMLVSQKPPPQDK
ncbi:hypothetical protein NLI96_g10725 [Meripilus lineatus]|uniref:Uncharacterized protein n=1 Tax=Meripilus lineatus TaxID=2056292 RepID=A0AAD5UT49_9APHY|nr:hypothetical protein NLI96_g10725 [Physisporinus lineatus]